MKERVERFYVDDEMKTRLCGIARLKANSKELGKKLGYKGKHTARRFNEFRTGVIKTFASYQLEQPSEITGVPLKDILKHTKLKTKH